MNESIEKWGELLDKTNLTDVEKEATRIRVLSVLKKLRTRLSQLSFGFTVLRSLTTVGSLLVPSLLAIQTTGNQDLTYWTMWGVGLVVSISNAIVSLFRIDKNYFTVGQLVEKIESEAWMFLTQSGTYSSDEDHRENFHKFIERCEVLLNKAIQAEYIGHNNGIRGNSSQVPMIGTPIPLLKDVKIDEHSSSDNSRFSSGDLVQSIDDSIPNKYNSQRKLPNDVNRIKVVVRETT